jgi:ribose transport system permease protein
VNTSKALPGPVRIEDESAATAEAQPTPVRRRPVTRLLESYALLVLLAALVVFFSVWPQTAAIFPTAANLKILVASQAVLGVVALGMLIPLVCQEFDLSVGAVTALSAVATAQLLTAGQPIVAGIVAAIGIGAAVGVVNGLVVTRMGVNAVVATLGTTTIITGVIRQDTGGIAAASNIPESLTNLGAGAVLGIPNIFIALLVIAAGVYFVLGHTTFGRQLYALGSNPDAAELVGLRTRRIRFLALFLGATLCGLAGLLYVIRAGGADPKIGDAFLLPAWAAAFLSAASVQPGRYNVWGAIIAIYFLAVLNNGLNLAGAQPYMSNYINGAALILGVALATYMRRRSTGSR